MLALLALTLAAHAGEPAPAAFTAPAALPSYNPNLRHRAVRTMEVGAGLALAAVPVGFGVAIATVPTCSPQARECMGPLILGAFTGFLVEVAGVTTLGVGTTELAVDAVRRHRVAVGISPNGVLVAGAF